MTRINAGIPPRELTTQHLIAEHREIKRIPNHLNKHGLKCLNNAPNQFTLGTGHVLFFISIGLYTYNRYVEIYNECRNRDINVTWFGEAWDIYKIKYPHLYNDWEPTPEAIKLIRERIAQRLSGK